MNHFCSEWIEEWCYENGWTDPFVERRSYWAFPPNAVMPLPIPSNVLRTIKAQKGLSSEERVWCISAFLAALGAAIAGYAMTSPMPLVAAFAFCTITVARMEVEELES